MSALTDTSTPTADQYLTADEVAAIIRMSPDYVTRQCKAGALKATKLGNQWRVRPADLETFMAAPPPPTRIRQSARQRRRAAS